MGGLIGAILAGGANSRFGGKAKGLLPVAGLRMIDRVATALGSVSTEMIVVSNMPGAADWLPGVNAVADLRPERGSLVGIHTALAHTRETVLVVAWDMPFVNAELLRLIRDRSAAASFAAVPDGPFGPEAFCAAYDAACLPFIEAALDGGDFRLSTLLGRLPSVDHVAKETVWRAGDPARLFFNVNDAADLARAERLAASA
ncbi:MAG TPA: molybdenum cofactor guanylyltransferase [Gemmatimonadaceae bacterium]